MSLFDDASLVLIPDGAKDSKLYSIKPTDGGGDFTFSRGSNLAATRVNENGLIEKGRENLFLQSNTFSSVSWLKEFGASVTGSQSGYDGSSDAWRLDTDGTQFSRLRQTLLKSGLQTISLYAKAGTLDWIALYNGNGSGSAFFDLTNGVTGNLGGGTIDASITSVGGGWYRCEYSFNESITDVRIYLTGANGTFTTTAGNIYIQDAQLEVGSVATEYIKSTSTTGKAGVLEDLPRIDYSEGGCPSLLLEPQRTNLVRQSEYYNTYWNINDATIEDNSVSSPEGLINASKLIETATNARHRLGAGLITIASTGVYVASVFLKKGTARYGFVGIGVASNSYTIVVDLEDGTITDTATSGTIAYQDVEDYGDGWYRCSVGGNITATSSFYVMQIGSAGSAQPTYNNYIPQFLGSTSNNLYVYGAQTEAGSYPTSYIPTYGSSVTRTQDVCKISGSNSITDNPSMTLFAEMNHDTANTNTTILSIIRKSSGGLYGDFISFIMRTDSEFQLEVRSNNTAQAAIRSSSISSGNHKIAAVLENNNVKLFVDGVLAGSDTSVTLPTGLDEIYLNGYPDSSARYGTKKQYLYFPTALTDSECIALTTI